MPPELVLPVDVELWTGVFGVYTEHSLVLTLLILVSKINSAKTTLQSTFKSKSSASKLRKHAIVFCRWVSLGPLDSNYMSSWATSIEFSSTLACKISLECLPVWSHLATNLIDWKLRFWWSGWLREWSTVFTLFERYMFLRYSKLEISNFCETSF